MSDYPPVPPPSHHGYGFNPSDDDDDDKDKGKGKQPANNEATNTAFDTANAALALTNEQAQLQALFNDYQQAIIDGDIDMQAVILEAVREIDLAEADNFGERGRQIREQINTIGNGIAAIAPPAPAPAPATAPAPISFVLVNTGSTAGPALPASTTTTAAPTLRVRWGNPVPNYPWGSAWRFKCEAPGCTGDRRVSRYKHDFTWHKNHDCQGMDGRKGFVVVDMDEAREEWVGKYHADDVGTVRGPMVWDGEYARRRASGRRPPRREDAASYTRVSGDVLLNAKKAGKWRK
jgi:hypothetical protein